MLSHAEIFEQAREYAAKLGDMVDNAPSTFSDDAFLSNLQASAAEAERRFCNLEVYDIQQAIEQLRVAIGEYDMEHVGLTGVSIAAIIDRIEMLAVKEREATQ